MAEATAAAIAPETDISAIEDVKKQLEDAHVVRFLPLWEFISMIASFLTEAASLFSNFEFT